MYQKNLCHKFLNKIFNNFKNSKNIFYRDNNNEYTYKESFPKICKLINFIKFKKTKKIIVLSDKSLNYY